MDTCKLLVLSSGLLFATSVHSVEFNLNALDKSMRDSVDISLLKEKAAIAPGNYFVSVAVNKNLISAGQELSWKAKDNAVTVCIPVELADQLGLKENIRAALTLDKGCVDFSNHPTIQFSLDSANQRLDITIPQALLSWKSDNWMPPSSWDAGVAGLLLDYNLFASTYRPHHREHTENINAYGTAGLNAGAWRLRSDYQISQNHNGESSQTTRGLSRTYLFRPLPALGARLTLGETDFSSSIFDAFAYNGAALASDDRMLPWELRGYAPQISGIAQTNATVTVSHAGRVIYQTKVAPGPFIISDLNQSVQGTLDVKVTEEDGRVNSFQVSAASTPFLTREGQVRYKLAAGRARPDISHHVVDDTFISSEASWGMLSNTSVYGGVLAAGSDYRSVALGIGQNMLWLGALSFDATHASSTFEDGHTEKGLSYRLNYSKRVDATDSQISLAAYRFSEREFHSYANFIAHQYNDADTQDEKQTISLSFNQPITPLNLNLYVSALRQKWWDGDSSTTASITAGYNFDLGKWKGLTLSTSWSSTRYEESGTDNQLYVSLSIPFGYSRRLNYDMRNSATTSNMLSWSDASNPRNTWGVSAGVETDKPDNGSQFRGNLQHLTSLGDLQLAGSYAASDYSSLSASWNGSITATRHGLAMHRRSFGNEPRIMIDTDGVSDVPVQGDFNRTNLLGYAVVPMAGSYQPTSIAVNMNQLPDGVTVNESITREAWTEGAIGYKTVASRAGSDVSVILRTADGGYPPLGAVIQQSEGNVDVGMVSEEGHAWLGGIKGNQQFSVIWGKNQRCSLSLPDDLSVLKQHTILPCH
ncbi:fimbria/pilus outer membrane usher protein [Pseudocitrobacter vendiensis]|uniref:Fimbrial biogenesis outer membrane usher protein n=1 Tax=Pseudocitrobacter vendiensis TaxID=2488306 RepID=A0ABN8TIJ4_9ENTR|nr:fimbria/pilus outer membrane usher protein [Pseudocitrobacter vendiensis]CAH6661394.1 Fimbrial biogenesis outer membrane usher protein [Pseudocitrobacter vendiensis]